MPVLRFHLLTIDHEMWDGGFTVTITTNAACHLYLRYSDIFPRIHRKSVARRGLVMGWDARYCFAAYQHIEQNEPGDTFTHTFTWPDWENCNTRYFYFWGTMGGQDMVSDTPIFWLHYLYVAPPPFVYFYSEPHPETTSVDGWVRETVSCPACTWAHVRDGPGDSFADGVNLLMHQLYHWRNPGEWSSLSRSIELFNTSSITAGKTIHAAELRIYVINQVIEPDWPDCALSVVSSLPAFNSRLQNSDYATLGILALSAPIPFTSLTAGNHHTFTFNADGLAAIAKEGITKLGLREHAYDRADIEPPYSRFGWARIDCTAAEDPNIAFRPRLGVSYS